MLLVPKALSTQFEAIMRSRGVPNAQRGAYRKWLRYYLDFCTKYHFPQEIRDSLTPFLLKLQEKKQTVAQQQAVQALSLYFELLRSDKVPIAGHSSEPVGLQSEISPELPRCPISSVHEATASSSPETTLAKGYKGPDDRPLLSASEPNKAIEARRPDSRSSENILVKPTSHPVSLNEAMSMTTGVSRRGVFTRLAEEIQLRHYSPKTLKNYKMWVRKFQTFTRSRDPQSLSSSDVKEFPTSLAVTRNVSASTQNQAFNALLFFYLHVLDKQFGKIDGVVRAKRKPYIPVVLSRGEINSILKNLSPPYDLVVKLLYGCGLRLSECLELRVF
jgi:hypothetical protein